tara:strand:+ start:685 stop:1353 length:669 start_codon:yes stop_codon:yes gene_type:complete
MKRFAIIVAGGKGNRMNAAVPKQFLAIGRKPILMRTIEQFYKTDSSITIILVLPKEQIIYWQELQNQYGFEVPVLVTAGGTSRFHSVKNGLSLINEKGIVAVHDGVRPFVTSTTILKGYEAAGEHQAAIPVVDVVDSIRLVTESDNMALNRADYRLVQTPQVFQTELLKKGYEQDFSESFTDDASVVDALGASIYLFEGNRENIKLTTPFDLKVAEVMLSAY